MASQTTGSGRRGSPSGGANRKDENVEGGVPSDPGAEGDDTGSHLSTLPPLDPPLCDLDPFAKQHRSYPHCIVTAYQIMRDLHIKQELIDLRLVDAAKWGRSEYFIEGRTRIGGKTRLLAPFYLDAEIDLPWVVQLAKMCEAQNQELYLCIHTPESVIYEMVSTTLP